MTFTINDADMAPSTADSTTLGTTLAFLPTSVVAVNQLAVLLVNSDNVDGTDADDTTFLSVADTKSNTWTRASEAQYATGGTNTGVINGIFYSVITTQIETTDTITITWTATVDDRGATLATFNRDTSASISVAGKSFQRATGATYTVTVGSLTNEEHLWIGHNAHEFSIGDTNNIDTGFTAFTQGAGGAWGTSDGSGRGGYLIETGTTQTYNASALANCRRCTALVAFREVAGGGGGGTTVLDPIGQRGFFGA